MNKSRGNNFLDNVVQWCVVVLLFLPVSLAYVFMYTLLSLKRLKLRISKAQKGQLAYFHGSKMIEIKALSTEEQLDFTKHRSPSYLKQLTFGSLVELSKLAGQKQNVPLIDDDAMFNVIMNSVFCHGLKKGEKNSNIAWRLPFHLDDYHMFGGFYWDVSEIRIHTDDRLSIVDKSGAVHTPQSSNWSLAKAHAQVQLTFFGPGLAHNHVHFVFPSVMASQARSVLPKTSLLRQLLEPHTRFTQYINYKALNECQSSRNTMSFVDRYLKPWLSFPIHNDDFIHGIQKNCETFYYENLTLTQNLEEDLPYHKFLKEYYNVIRQFVGKIEPLITEDYEKMTSPVIEFLPMLKGKSACDVITTLMWNCAVVHFSDHHSYLRWFANDYGCMCMRTPLVKISNKNGFANGNHKQRLEQTPDETFFDGVDVYRTRCFLKSFVQYNGSNSIDMTLSKTNYDFSNKAAINAAEEFFKNLAKLDQKMRSEKRAIIELSEIIRSVCF